MRKRCFRRYVIQLLMVIGVLSGVNLVSSRWHFRWDLTSDKRYTLSPITKKILSEIQEPVKVEVLLSGTIPSEFRKLQSELKQLLEEYGMQCDFISFDWVNPLEADETTTARWKQLGVSPIQVSSREQGRTLQEYVFPWVIVQRGKRWEAVSVFQNSQGLTTREHIQESVQRLEYVLTDALYRLFLKKEKKIAVLRSNGCLEDIFMADFLSQEGRYYRVAPFSLDSARVRPRKVLQQLQPFDLLVIPRPTLPFTEEQKLIVDQYIMNGGRTLWLVDGVSVSSKEIQGTSGQMMAMPLDLHLEDMFFSYGFRVNHKLVKDPYATPIVVAEGSGSQTRYITLPCPYYPMLISKNNHLIDSSLGVMKGEFIAPLDTLSNSVEKTILLSSSELSHSEGVPRMLTLFSQKELDTITQGKSFPVSLLLEGSFPSMYNHRIVPVKEIKLKNQSTDTKMIIVSDGDFIKNETEKGSVLELGYDKWTGRFYDNKAFLQNSINYLLGDESFLTLRNRKVRIAFLDRKKMEDSSEFWRNVILICSVLTVSVFGGIYSGLHHRKYGYKAKK